MYASFTTIAKWKDVEITSVSVIHFAVTHPYNNVHILSLALKKWSTNLTVG